MQGLQVLFCPSWCCLHVLWKEFGRAQLLLWLIVSWPWDCQGQGV